MKKIDIVTGFFESGKTTFIKKYIENELTDIAEDVVVISNERGLEGYDGIKALNLRRDDDFKAKATEFINNESPERVIIEYNGTMELSNVLKTKWPRGYEIRNVITVCDSRGFENKMRNMSRIMNEKISNSDIVIFNRADMNEIQEVNNRDRIIQRINPDARILYDEELFTDKYSYINNSALTPSDMALLKLPAFILLFVVLSKLLEVMLPELYSQKIANIYAVFVSILIQIIPFLILGAVLSAIIQILIPRQKFLEIFSKTGHKSLFTALFAGALFPVCDCAMVPIASSMAKRGSSIPSVIAFLMASPAVNPIVILSTIYAFPAMHKMVIFRIIFGLIVAYLVGLVLFIAEKRGVRLEAALQSNTVGYDSLYEVIRLEENTSRLQAMIRHVRTEFFKTGSYVVVGAFLSSVLREIIPKGVLIGLGSHTLLSIIAMIAASIFISVCSTSNAFIARIFFQSMPRSSILAFMITGPMIDITNMSVISSTFKKRFVIGLMGLIAGIATIVFLVASLLI